MLNQHFFPVGAEAGLPTAKPVRDTRDHHESILAVEKEILHAHRQGAFADVKTQQR